MGIIIPAIQSGRESAHRIQCANNLKQQVLAVSNFHETSGNLPPGRCILANQDYSWSAAVLPHLGESNLWSGIDFRSPWNSTRNLTAARVSLPIFLCPSANRQTAGETHYGGVMGSGLRMTTSGDLHNGAMIFQCPETPNVIRWADFSDGMSNTIAIGETGLRDATSPAEWADGNNCFIHGQPINTNPDGFSSAHRGGCHVAFADGSVKFLSASIDNGLLSDLCTRAGGEVFSDHP